MSKELYQEIQRRNIPSVLQMQNGEPVTDINGWKKRREEIIRLYQEQMYGDTGLDKGKVTWKVLHQYDKFLADKAVYQQIQVKYQSSVGEYEFPFHLTLPKSEKKVPVFLMMWKDKILAVKGWNYLLVKKHRHFLNNIIYI